METGPAAEEMRLSFKGSGGDVVKLPITHLVHASVGLRTQERQRERRRGEDGGMMKRVKVSALFLKHTLLAGDDNDSKTLYHTALPGA